MQHILRRACKFAINSTQEAQLTIGTLNEKLNDLGDVSSSKVSKRMLASPSWHMIAASHEQRAGGVSLINLAVHCRSLRKRFSHG